MRSGFQYFYHGKVLDNGRDLSDYGIKDMDIIAFIDSNEIEEEEVKEVVLIYVHMDVVDKFLMDIKGVLNYCKLNLTISGKN